MSNIFVQRGDLTVVTLSMSLSLDASLGKKSVGGKTQQYLILTLLRSVELLENINIGDLSTKRYPNR